jgi:hypothetical protein
MERLAQNYPFPQPKSNERRFSVSFSSNAARIDSRCIFDILNSISSRLPRRLHQRGGCLCARIGGQIPHQNNRLPARSTRECRMASKRLWIGFVTVYVATQVMGGLGNFYLFDPIYNSYSHIWRPIEDVNLWILPVTGVFFLLLRFHFFERIRRKGRSRRDSLRVLYGVDDCSTLGLHELCDDANSVFPCSAMVHVQPDRICHCRCNFVRNLQIDPRLLFIIVKDYRFLEIANGAQRERRFCCQPQFPLRGQRVLVTFITPFLSFSLIESHYARCFHVSNTC